MQVQIVAFFIVRSDQQVAGLGSLNDITTKTMNSCKLITGLLAEVTGVH